MQTMLDLWLVQSKSGQIDPFVTPTVDRIDNDCDD